MANGDSIIGIDDWLQTPPGRYLLAWEQAQLDRVVADVFGYHAVQLGWPALQGLRCNRMPHRWLLGDGVQQAGQDPSLARLAPEPVAGAAIWPPAAVPLSVLSDYEALPFPSASLDLVVLPHTLELAADPHHTLREVERVLMPEGRLVVVGFNPASLWGAYQASAELAGRVGIGKGSVPGGAELISWLRLRDWLRLLDLEFESGQFGCYRPPLATQRWLDRCGWFDRAGARWWPVLGSAYVLVAVKRVRAMRLLGPAWRKKTQGAQAPAVVARREQP
ncbi:MAG: class I SAM-dependent methyltransferase [Leptothrix sp. (in: b-proteobacteria)]